MRKHQFIGGAILLFVLVFAGCSLSSLDPIVGKWREVGPVLVTVIQFTDSTYTYSVGGATSNTRTWTKSGNSYTLNGGFFGFVSTNSTITPTLSNSNNTMSFTDGLGVVETYDRQ
jgi:hypothetical protein